MQTRVVEHDKADLGIAAACRCGHNNGLSILAAACRNALLSHMKGRLASAEIFTGVNSQFDEDVKCSEECNFHRPFHRRLPPTIK